MSTETASRLHRKLKSKGPKGKPLTEEEERTKNLVDIIVNNTIETPIAEIREKCKATPREEVIEKINALKVELVKLQYQLREYSILEWYDNELDDSRKHLHDVFERNRDFFKAGSRGENWLVLSTNIPAHSKGFEEFKGSCEEDNQGPYYFMYYTNNGDVAAAIDKMRKRDTNKILCVPLFKAV